MKKDKKQFTENDYWKWLSELPRENQKKQEKIFKKNSERINNFFKKRKEVSG